jgi:hypothetical protein
VTRSVSYMLQLVTVPCVLRLPPVFSYFRILRRVRAGEHRPTGEWLVVLEVTVEVVRASAGASVAR